jgi:general stress protein 13
MKIGDVVTGTVTGLQEYGVFVKVGNYDGLIHISELSDKFVRDVRDYLTVGDIIDLKVLEIDESRHKLKLSYKAIKDRRINRKYLIGFKSLENKMPKWIESKLKEIDNE